MPKFPGPTYNKIIEPESDRQIKTVPLEKMGFGARKTSQMNAKNDYGKKIRHIKNES